MSSTTILQRRGAALHAAISHLPGPHSGAMWHQRPGKAFTRGRSGREASQRWLCRVALGLVEESASLGSSENQHPIDDILAPGLASSHRTESKNNPAACPHGSTLARRMSPHDALRETHSASVRNWFSCHPSNVSGKTVYYAHHQLSFFLKRIITPCFAEQLTCW